MMEADKHVIWNEAAKAGLVLGLFSGSVIIANAVLTSLAGESFAGRLICSISSVAMWLIKFFGCLWILRFHMLKFACRYPKSTNRTTFRFGMMTALSSALIVSAISLANILLISPDSMQETIDTAMQSYTAAVPLGDSDRVAIERMLGWLPQISFFTTLTYCFLYGTVAAKIFSAGIPPKNIFSDNSQEDSQEDK